MTAAKPKRPPTLGDQLAAQHELLMAAVSKTMPRGKRWEVTADQQKIGDLKGQWLGGVVAAPDDDEDWPQFFGRWQGMITDVSAFLMRHNADEIKRQLEASVQS